MIDCNLNTAGLSKVYLITKGQAQEIINEGKKFVEVWDVPAYSKQPVKRRVYDGGYFYNDFASGIQPDNCSLFLNREDAVRSAKKEIQSEIRLSQVKIKKHQDNIKRLKSIEVK